MIYTTTSTTKNIRSLVGKCFLLVISMLLCGVSVWAADKTVSSAEIYEGDYTVNAGETLKITSTGTFTITGNLINNGGTIIVDGGTLEVGGKLDNKVVASGETDQDWKPNGNSTEKYFTNSDYSGSGSSANNKSSYSSYDTRYRKTTQPQKAVTNQNTYMGNISIINGNLSVSGNMTNAGNVSVKTTDATSIARIAISGNFENTSTTLTLKTYTYTRDKITKEVRKSNTSWNNPSNITSTEESYNPENPKATEGTTQTVSSATITLDNGYLVVNGDATLEDKTTINFNQSTKNLKSQVDGNDVVVVSTFLVKGDLIQNETAQIQYGGDNGMLVVSGNIDDKTGTADDSVHPWTFTKDGTKSVTVPVDDFVLIYGSYAKEKKDVETIQDQIDQKSNNLESLKYLYNAWDDLGLVGRGFYIAGLAFISGGTIWGPGDVSKLIQQTELDIEELENQKKLAEEYNLDVADIDAKELEKKIEEIITLLPITLNYFVAHQDGDEVAFEWQTSSEVNNDFFTIEYSLDGIHFSELANEDGNGTTSEINDYTVSVSADGFAGITYFRLKQTDFNGEYSYSDVILLNVENETSLYVYPNPAVDVITIAGSFERISVCDAYSRTLSVQQESTNSFNVSALPVGTYYVVATTKQGKKVLPFVKR